MTRRIATVDVCEDAGRALRMLTSERTPCVVACREGTPVGLVTLLELGVVCAVHWPDLSAPSLRVHQIMATPLVVVGPTTTLADLMPVLLRSDLEHLVVMDGSELLGVVERGKLFRACLKLIPR